jgi:cytosine/adenosine deaminase-related metal-dependent hydrolase
MGLSPNPCVGRCRYSATADLLIEGGTVLTADGDRRIVEDGTVAVDGGEVVSLGEGALLAQPVHVDDRDIPILAATRTSPRTR